MYNKNVILLWITTLSFIVLSVFRWWPQSVWDKRTPTVPLQIHLMTSTTFLLFVHRGWVSLSHLTWSHNHWCVYINVIHTCAQVYDIPAMKPSGQHGTPRAQGIYDTPPSQDLRSRGLYDIPPASQGVLLLFQLVEKLEPFHGIVTLLNQPNL